MIKSINPANETIIAEFKPTLEHQIDELITKAKKAQKDWQTKPKTERIKTIRDVKGIFERRKEELIACVNEECGFDKADVEAVIFDILDGFDYYLDAYEKTKDFDFPLNPAVFSESSSEIKYCPLGVVAQIGAWNYPVWQTMITAIPALLTGNSIVYKPSEKSTKTGLLLSEIINSELPDGLFNVVIGGPEQGKYLVSSDVDAVVYTGNIKTGKEIVKLAALKPCILELSGNDAAIVCSDADIAQAVDGIAYGAFLHSGEVCIRIKRVYAVKDIADEFTKRLTDKVKQIKEAVTPLIRSEALSTVEQQVNKAVSEGAEVIIGGKRADRKGYYYEPTILRLKSNDCLPVREEIFGPVLSILTVDDEKTAMKYANSTQFGLGTSIWTQNYEKSKKLTDEAESGVVWVNDSNLPLVCGEYFRGWKNSSIEGSSDRLRQFMKTKAVISHKSTNRRPWWY